MHDHEYISRHVFLPKGVVRIGFHKICCYLKQPIRHGLMTPTEKRWCDDLSKWWVERATGSPKKDSILSNGDDGSDDTRDATGTGLAEPSRATIDNHACSTRKFWPGGSVKCKFLIHLRTHEPEHVFCSSELGDLDVMTRFRGSGWTPGFDRVL